MTAEYILFADEYKNFDDIGFIRQNLGSKCQNIHTCPKILLLKGYSSCQWADEDGLSQCSVEPLDSIKGFLVKTHQPEAIGLSHCFEQGQELILKDF